MGEVVQFDPHRARRLPPAPVSDDPALEASGLVDACLAMAAGVRQMRTASVMLAEAAADLRDLARGEPI